MLGTVYQPNLTRATLVIAGIAVASAGGGTVDTVSIDVGATNPPLTTVGVVSNKFFGAGDTPELIIPCTFVVPPAQFYQIFVSASAGVGGFPNINSVSEITL